MVEEFVSRVFATRNAVHLAHWRETSGFRHEVLGDFYGALIEGVDGIVEDYQGAFGLIDSGLVEIVEVATSDILTHIDEEARWIADNRDALADGNPALAAKVDDFLGEYLRTIYKLRQLS